MNACLSILFTVDDNYASFCDVSIFSLSIPKIYRSAGGMLMKLKKIDVALLFLLLVSLLVIIPYTNLFIVRIVEFFLNRNINEQFWSKKLLNNGISVFLFLLCCFFLKLYGRSIAEKLSPKERNFVLPFIFLSVLSLFLMLGDADNFKYYFHQNSLDTFMDLFNSIVAEKDAKWGENVPGFYPPLAVIPYRIFSHSWNFGGEVMFPRDAAFKIRNSVFGFYLICLHVGAFIIPLFLLFLKKIKGSSNKKIFLSILLCSSGVVLWSIERGNSIIYAMLFTLLFVVLYESENLRLKNMACVCFAVAVNIKIYPAVFGLILLEKKDWKNILKSFLYTAGIYVATFAICGYRTADFGSNVSAGVAWGESTTDLGSGLNFSIQNISRLINTFVCFIQNPNVASRKELSMICPNYINMYRIITLVMFFSLFVLFFFLEKKWMKLMIPSLMCILIPPASYMYVLLFLMIPFLYYINERNVSKMDKIYSVMYAVLFSIIVIPVTLPASPYSVTGCFILQTCAVFFFFVDFCRIAAANLINRKFRTVSEREAA